MRGVAILIGYVVWFLFLVRILFLSTGNPYTNTADILGSHAGLAFWLLVLSLIPFFIARARAKKSGAPISRPFVMAGVTLIALALSVGGFYARSKTVPAQAVASPSQQSQESMHVEQSSDIPTDEQDCFNRYGPGPSSVKNAELLREFCHSAFDATEHPVARARHLCKVITWATEPNRDPTDVTLECDKKNPLPACPEKMEFDLYNMRCEVTCDGLHGYAPDPSGKSCYLACPDGGWPIYAGTVKACNAPL